MKGPLRQCGRAGGRVRAHTHQMVWRHTRMRCNVVIMCEMSQSSIRHNCRPATRFDTF